MIEEHPHNSPTSCPLDAAARNALLAVRRHKYEKKPFEPAKRAVKQLKFMIWETEGHLLANKGFLRHLLFNLNQTCKDVDSKLYSDTSLCLYIVDQQMGREF